jgi:hypothetical protein
VSVLGGKIPDAVWGQTPHDAKPARPAEGVAPVLAAADVLLRDAGEPHPLLTAAYLVAAARWFTVQTPQPAASSCADAARPPHGVRRCVAVRRGHVALIADDGRAARDMAEAYRAVKTVLDAGPRRRDHINNVWDVVRYLFAYTDHATMRTRPGHDNALAALGMNPRTFRRCLDTLHELGLLTTMEEGTTEWLRKARLQPGQVDPYEHNRAEDYLWCIPAWVTALITADSPTPAPAQASTELTVPPSRSLRRRETGTTTSGSYQPAGSYTRTRIQRSGRPQRDGKIISSRGRTVPRPPTMPDVLRDRLAEVTAVWRRAMPAALTATLTEHEVQRLATEVARQLEHRTADELCERITRHWDYWRYKLAAELIRSPIAAATRMLRRDFDCPDIRCEDRWQLDLDAPCKACANVAEAIAVHRHSASGAMASAQTTLTDHSAPTSPKPPTPTPSPVPLPPTRVADHAAQARALLIARSPGARKIIGKKGGPS